MKQDNSNLYSFSSSKLNFSLEDQFFLFKTIIDELKGTYAFFMFICACSRNASILFSCSHSISKSKNKYFLLEFCNLPETLLIPLRYIYNSINRFTIYLNFWKVFLCVLFYKVSWLWIFSWTWSPFRLIT